jgi:predicted PurR-regulated permease PerM
MVLVLIAAVWLLDKTSTIVDPLIAGFVLGAVSGVIVDRLEHLGWPRAAGAGLVTVALFVLAVLVIGLVLGGITSQASHIDASLSQALDKVQKWAQDLGISSAPDAAKEIAKAVPEAGRTLLNGVASGISGLTSLLVFLGFTIFAAFFLLKDGPSIGRWIERHMGMQPSEARIVLDDIIQALRRYFLGLTIIAGLSTAGVVLGALIVGVPMLGTIAIVTFLASYVPILGAWTAGICRLNRLLRLPHPQRSPGSAPARPAPARCGRPRRRPGSTRRLRRPTRAPSAAHPPPRRPTRRRPPRRSIAVRLLLGEEHQRGLDATADVL